MEIIVDAFLDALIDGVKMLPFLYLAYLLIEWLERNHGERIEKALAGGGHWGFVPGALLGLFVGSWAWMLRAQAESGNTSTALWVASFAGIFVCTGFFTWLLAQVPLVDLPLAQIAKNAGLMFFGFFPRTAAAALVLALYWGATLLYLPATILTILAFGFWLPVTIALMIVYPGLEKVFKLEETINARRAAEIEERRISPNSTSKGDPVWKKIPSFCRTPKPSCTVSWTT